VWRKNCIRKNIVESKVNAMNRMLPALLLATACLSVIPRPVGAVLVTYGSLSAFNSAIPASNLVDFSGSSFVGLTDNGTYWNTFDPAGFSLGGATFTVSGVGPLYQTIVAPALSPAYYERGTGNQLYVDPDLDLIITFSAPVEAVAFDLSGLFFRSGDTALTFSNGDTATVQLGDPWRFNGFQSDTPFSSITIAGVSTQTLLFDNIRYATAIEEARTPEPASLALLGLGLAVLAAARRRA
jgi:hypothetical protein